MTIHTLLKMPIGGSKQLRPHGGHMTLPLLSQFYVTVIFQSCLLAISWAKAWGDPKKPKLGMAYFLIVPVQMVEEERIFRLVVMWVHPCQTLLSSLEEAAKKLTLLVNTGDDWPYTVYGCVRILNMSPSLMQGMSASW